MTEMSVPAAFSASPWPYIGSRPCVGLWPKMPQAWAGWRMEPPMSLPASSPHSPAAIAAAPPPEDPPGVVSRSQGLLVRP